MAKRLPCPPKEARVGDPGVTDELRALVEELNHAQKESYDVAGPMTMRLHEAILALCDYVGIENIWQSEP